MEVQKKKVLEAIIDPSNDYFYQTNQNDFEKIPGSPISFWVNEKIIYLYNNGIINDKYVAKEGVGTRNDSIFLKNYWEVNCQKIGRNKRWILIDKAGSYRKWYLGQEFVMDWEYDGYRIKNYKTSDGKLKSRPQNLQYLFLEGVSWGKVGSGSPSFRYRFPGLGFNDAAPAIFGKDLFVSLAALNSRVIQNVLLIKGGTLNITGGVVAELPLLGFNLGKKTLEIEKKSKENIDISKTDWDKFEISFEFIVHPLL